MRWSICFTLGLLTALQSVTAVNSLQAQNRSEQAEPTAQEDADAAIRATVEQFVTAYNAGDAKAVAALFLPQAQIVDEDDNTIQGQENIEKLFAAIFEQHPENQIEVNIESIRFIGKNLALETGSTITIPPAGEVPQTGRYTVLHILNGDKWSMGLVRDIPSEPTHRDQLEALAWLVGDWVDESREGVVKTSCRWAESGSFLLQEIVVQQAGQELMTISQRIGWDPLSKRFKAWVFDSEGGYGESNWTPTETGWLIKATSVNNDGSTASATNHIEPTGLDRYVFRSVDRVSGNEILPPVQVIVVRQPPLPQGSEVIPTSR